MISKDNNFISDKMIAIVLQIMKFYGRAKEKQSGSIRVENCIKFTITCCILISEQYAFKG